MCLIYGGIKKFRDQPCLRTVFYFIFFAGQYVLPQMPLNLTLEFPIDGLAPGDRFSMHNAANIKKDDEHSLGWAANLPHIFSVMLMIGFSTTKTFASFQGHTPKLHHW